MSQSIPEFFPAFRIHAADGFQGAAVEQVSLDQLSPGEVVLEVEYSSVNFKDALAGSGRGKILRLPELNGGIDLAGTVVASEHADFTPGQKVLANGSGLSEVHDGGYSHYARIPAEWLMPMPPGLDTRSAMILGTAGFTAALAVQRLLDNHQQVEQGPIVITGASGGVGSFAVQLLTQLGFDVIAMTRKQEHHAYLRSLGAQDVRHTDELNNNASPMLKGQWGGAIDNLGGDVLASLSKSVKPWGNIVSVGMAAGVELNTSTMPFILRGVSILGVTSAACPQALRKNIWQRLGSDWLPQELEAVCAVEIGLQELPQAFDALLKGQVQGRQLVRVKS